MGRYTNTPVVRFQKGARYFAEVKYPEVPLSPSDIYVVTSVGDRLDLLAQQYYGDSSLWWIISIANTELSQNSLYIPLGTQLRIPTNIENILFSYKNLNNV